MIKVHQDEDTKNQTLLGYDKAARERYICRRAEDSLCSGTLYILVKEQEESIVIV